MRIIDAHVHLYPPEVNRLPAAWAEERREPRWAKLCTRWRGDGKPVQTFPTVEQLLRAMDAAGVEKSVLLGWYWEQAENCAMQNRFYAECVRAHPDRLTAFATLQAAAGAGVLEIVKRARDEGFIGLGELSPHSRHFACDDAVWREVLALAGELKLPVNLHVTDPGSRRYPGRVETPLEDFLRMARDFPGTTFILAHWGGGLAFEPGDSLPANLLFDTAASPLLYGAEAWARGMAGAGAERILFGTDYPLVLYPKNETQPGMTGLLGEAGAAEVPSEALGDNAARLLGIY